MRITNTMMTNNMLLNINRNRTTMSLYEQQLSTGKVIQKPSEDPIVAVRALKFRTNVKELDQFKSNAEDASSWASVTEQAVTNVTDIAKRIRDLSVQATTDVMNIENRKNVITEIDELMEQFKMETNASYAGRHIFSGYQTDTPVVFVEASSDVYELTESFTSEDIESVQRVDNEEIIDVHRVRLGYKEIADITATGAQGLTAPAAPAVGLTMNMSPAVPPTTMWQSTDPGAYTPAVGTFNVLQDTGEIIFNAENVESTNDASYTGTATPIPDAFDFEYSKTDFKKGDLVPDHYFTGKNTSTTPDPTEFVLGTDEMLYQISFNQEIAVNTMANEVVTIDMVRDIEELIDTTTNIAADSSLTSELEMDLLGDMFDELLGKMDDHIDKLLNTVAGLGVKINRLDLTITRLEANTLNYTDLLSKNEDVNFAEVAIKMSSQETVYNASLQASAKIIQPSLLDFIG